MNINKFDQTRREKSNRPFFKKLGIIKEAERTKINNPAVEIQERQMDLMWDQRKSLFVLS